MTVAELIKKLEELPADAPVLTCDNEGELSEPDIQYMAPTVLNPKGAVFL